MYSTNSNYFKTHDRYFYQGSEMDKEVKGYGNSYTTTFRQLDPRLGRWMSLDPVFQPHQSPYNSMDNNPIIYNDPKGLSVKDWIGKKNNDGTTSWKWDENVTSPSQLPEGYTEYAKPGKEVTSITGEQLKLLDKGKIAKKQSSDEMTIYPNQPIDLTQNSQGFEPNPTVEQTQGMGVIPVLVYQAGYTNQWIRNLHADINFQITNRSLNQLGMGAMGLLAAPFVVEGGTLMVGQLTGEYGITTQVAAWYRVGNTLADATNQAIDMSVNGGSWNYGSTIGNLAFSNPFTSAAPGTIYKVMNDKNVHQNINSHFGNYLISVAGNYVSGGISKINPQFISGGMKHGLSGFGAPLLINTVTGGILNFKTN